MPRRRWTDEQRDQALALVAEVGTSEAARRTGVPIGTIGSWAHRAGVTAPDVDTTAAKTAARVATTAERRARLAENLLGDLEIIRERLTAPMTERVVRTVSLGNNAGSETEIVDVELDMPKPADQRALMAAITAGLDAIQVALGEATERIELLTSEPPERTPEAEADVAQVLELVRAS